MLLIINMDFVHVFCDLNNIEFNSAYDAVCPDTG